MFRGRREERRREREADHYRMRQKLVSIGDDYWIENDRANASARSTARPCGCARH